MKLTTLITLLSMSAFAAPAGSVPTGMPTKLSVGLFEDTGNTWMAMSGTKWNLKYRYLVYGWSSNYGFGPKDGAFAGQFFRDADVGGFIPAVAYYEMYDIPPANTGFGAKTTNPSAMLEYFTDFKLLMQQVKAFGKPVVIMLEADGYAYLQGDTANNPNAPAAIASTGMPELASLPNTAAGWGLAFLQIRKSVGANNAILGIHISGWATGADLFHFSVTDPLQPAVDSVYNFLAPLGLAANVTGATYDVLVGDPLDRDADFYRLTRSEDRWWDTSDLASVNSKSMNRYLEWVRLWNLKSGKRWVLWQIPLGNSSSPNTCAAGYKDNRTEYFFGANSQSHLQKVVDNGVVSLLFGAGADCQATQETDNNYIKTNAAAYLAGPGISLAVVVDAGVPVSVPDAGMCTCVCTCPQPVDSGTPVVDAGVKDAGIPDAGKVDSGTAVVDAGVKDAGQPIVDAGVKDAGSTPTDAGIKDAGVVVVDAGTPTSSDQAQFNFETDVQGFKSDQTDVLVFVTTAVSFAGTHSLSGQIDVTAAATRQIYVPYPGQLAGKTISFRVMVPTTAPLTSLQVYAQEGVATSWRWNAFWAPGSTAATGKWVTYTLKLPTNASSLQSLGVEFQFSAAYHGPVYIDSISWDVTVNPNPVVDAGTTVPVDAGVVVPIVDAGTVKPPDAGVLPPVTGQIRLMPLGDSITAESHAWRCELWKEMTDAGYDVLSVGSVHDQYDSCASEHEGNSGWTIADLDGKLNVWLPTYKPDVVIMLAGTNDVAWWSAETGTSIADRADKMITHIQTLLPNVRLVVQTLPPESSSIIAPNNVDRQVLVKQYNDRLKILIAARVAAGQAIRLSDTNAVLSLADLRDGIHPTPEAGIAKIAPTIWAALKQLLP